METTNEYPRTYKVERSLCYRNPFNGHAVSFHGAYPGPDYVVEERGWTVRNLRTGAVGLYRGDWETEAEAQAWCDAYEDRMAEHRASL